MPVDNQLPPAVAGAQGAGAAAQALCNACGYCCDGTLFAQVSVGEHDAVQPLLAAGIRITIKDAERCFRQPCAAHGGHSCAVYADRPATCRQFQCKLLRELESGVVEWPQALERIREVAGLKRAVSEELQRIEPALVGTSLAALRKKWVGLEDAAQSLALRRKYGTALICMVALAWYLQQHFCDDDAAEYDLNAR